MVIIKRYLVRYIERDRNTLCYLYYIEIAIKNISVRGIVSLFNMSIEIERRVKKDNVFEEEN